MYLKGKNRDNRCRQLTCGHSGGGTDELREY